VAVPFGEVLEAPQNPNKKRSRSRSTSVKQPAARGVRNNAVISVKAAEKKPLKENKGAATIHIQTMPTKKLGQDRERGVGVVKKFKK